MSTRTHDDRQGHPGQAHPPSAQASEGKHGGRAFLLAAGIALVAVVLAILWAVAAIAPLTDQVDGFARGDIPGEVTVPVDEPGEHVIYYERQTWFGSVPSAPELSIRVTDPEGDETAVGSYDAPVHYRLPGLVGEAVATFEAERPGDHTITVDGGVAVDDDARVAAGRSVLAGVAGGLIGPLVLGIGGLIAATVIVARDGARRSSSRR